MTHTGTHYDYIIAGAGAAGLSLAWHLAQESLRNKELLIVDADLSPRHDKTWCFWHTGEPPFARIICKSWKRARVDVLGKTVEGRLERYPYHCIRSHDFRRELLRELGRHPNVTLLEVPVEGITGEEKRALLHTAENEYTAEYIFQSCFSDRSDSPPPSFPLKQHFLGWEIETRHPAFDADRITLMDFDEAFDGEGVAFMYILPWSSTSALLEYTVFSENTLEEERYEEAIKKYLRNKLGLNEEAFSVKRNELGVIPMEDRSAPPWYAPRVLNIGLAGTLTKPSTGYTFTRIQQHSREIIWSLQQYGVPAAPLRSPLRFRAYDLWLLHILSRQPDDALRIFRDLFTRNSFDEVFRFLGEESNPLQDLRIMASVPWQPFFRAIWHTRGQLLKGAY